MMDVLTRLIGDSEAQDLAEYGIALAVVAAGAAMAAVAIGTATQTLWTRALQALIAATSL